jgi:uncharacterized protein (DUF362 family)
VSRVGDSTVAVMNLRKAAYPSQPPFLPSRRYPEQPAGRLGPENEVYEAVRELLRWLGLDEGHFDGPAWNPLAGLIWPGDRVVVKPNLLWQSHKFRLGEWQQVITHGSVVRAVGDFIGLALQGRGEIVIADGPQLDADWRQIIERTGLEAVADDLARQWSVPVRLLDLRSAWVDRRGDVDYATHELPGDPAGVGVVDLGEHSRFFGFPGEGCYYGADYDVEETNRHHHGRRHEYGIARTVLDCDVFVNLPKLKTHKKVGVTLAMKNLVGVNARRNWLPHYTTGSPQTGGDQFTAGSLKTATESWGMSLGRHAIRSFPVLAPAFRLAKRAALPVWGSTREIIRSGNWYGNDTCWRMVHDLNRAVLWGGGGRYPAAEPKRTLVVVDGVIGGEGDGPETPDAVPSGVLVAGTDVVAVDASCTRLMGFDPLRLSLLREAFEPSEVPLTHVDMEGIQLVGNHPGWSGRLVDVPWAKTLHFRPHFGWAGHIEGMDEADVQQ